MPVIHRLDVNCFPSCSNKNIIKGLKAMSPCIDIVRLRTSLPLQGNTGEKDANAAGELNKLLDFAKKLSNTDSEGKETAAQGQVEVGQNIGGFSSDYTKTKSDEIHFLDNFYGFFSMMTAEADRFAYDIPIISSPQIKVDTSSGWKHEQSLLSFVKNISNSGAIGGLLQSVNLTSVVNGVIDEIERIGGMAGWSPRIGPYFSLQDNPFNDRPSLTVEIKLINDTEEAALTNSLFLDQMLRNSLIGTGHATRSGGASIDDFGTVTSNSFFNTWHPPKLFNVGLKWGADSSRTEYESGNSGPIYVKRYYLCTLDATVQPEGIMRKGSKILGGRVPDVYCVNMTFNSLMPNTLDLWSGYGFSYSLNSSSVIKNYGDELAQRQAELDAIRERKNRKNQLEVRLRHAITSGDKKEIDGIYSWLEENGWSDTAAEFHERYDSRMKK